MIVEVIQPDFTAGENFGLLEQVVQFGVCGFVGQTRFVGVDARRCPDSRDPRPAGVPSAEFEGLMHGVRALADADGKNLAHARGPGAVQQGITVLVVARAVEMGVGVDHGWRARYFSRAPISTSSVKPARTALPSAVE